MVLSAVAMLSAAGCECACKNADPAASGGDAAAAKAKPAHDPARPLFDGKSLDGWEAANFGPQGPVEIEDGKIVLYMGDGCTGVTYTRGDFPKINYEVSLDAMRVEGNDFFCGMTFPVNDDPCTLIVGGWGGTVVGLSSVDGFDASENNTSTYRIFEKNRWYRIRLRVTANHIDAWIDDEHIIDFTKDDRKLSIRPEVELSRPFGITSWCTTAALKNIRVRPLTEAEIKEADQ